MQDIAYHYPYLAGLPGATDYPVHCAAGQNAVPTIGLVAYVGRELCADEAKEQTKEKPYLTFGCGAWVNAAKAGVPPGSSCLCRVLPCRMGFRRFHAWRLPASWPSFVSCQGLSSAWLQGCRRSNGNRSLPSCWSLVGSANNAFPLYSGRFSFTCPRTVLTRLHVYGSPSVTSSYLTHLWIFALHSAHTTKVFLCI